ncbi:zinc finger protein on ecdysone puffs-like isoform X2 [Epargyreus clarus]|uniref:zinc finger protein on ecdysone puffs-like isoform X2 n=1 Tax=Epargyreus clarus TaxID=520877 RepID=UPI003C2B0A54
MIVVMGLIGEEDKPEGETDATKSEDKKESPKTRYDDINPALLKCHICNKSMWDGRSFENHLSGRAHAIMMQKTAESYALTADTMRQEFKIREMKRTRKTGQQPPRDFYCAMCDLYAADGAIHRTTQGHRKLKKYLHPTCTSCHKEMPTRIELDEHRLTAEHLKNMQDKTDGISKPKPEVMVISTLDMEQSYLRDDRQRWRTDRDQKRDAGTTEEKQEEASEDKSEETVEENPEEKPEATEDGKHPLDNENTVLDYKEGDDLSHMTQEMLPVYSTERGVGRSYLSEFRCIQCTLCHKLLDSERTAEVHLRTWRHHQLFNRKLNERSGRLAGNDGAQANDTGKRAHNSEDEGNWKRRKTAQDAAGDQNGHHDEEVKDEPNKDADIDEGDVEMAEPEGEHPAEDDLEDWEHSVDEILKDETDEKLDEETQQDTEIEATVKQEGHEEVNEDSILEESPEKPESPPAAAPEPVPPPTPPVAATPQTPPTAAPPSTPRPKPTPRGRGRGRRRY